MTDFRIIIPARYHSKRLPGKPLVDICGKPMIQHVYERACESGAEGVTIATDHEDIAKAAEKFGADVWMTADDHRTGTDRLAETVVGLGLEDDDIVVNVQGDEPLIPPEVITQIAENLSAHDHIKVASLCAPIESSNELLDTNIVKVVRSIRGFGLYFSRAPVPWSRQDFPPKADEAIEGPYFRHIGLYGYRVGFLHQYLEWEGCPIEEIESLEQLRILYNGIRIHVDVASKPVPGGVDTQEDLDQVIALLAKSQ